MRRINLTFTFDATDDYCDSHILPLGKMLESGEFQKKFTDGIENKLTVIDAKLEISTNQDMAINNTI